VDARLEARHDTGKVAKKEKAGVARPGLIVSLF
jgi:hypothetical protein